MTSVSSTLSASTLYANRPPHPAKGGRGGNPVSEGISQALSSGSISATDASALTSALSSIDTSLSGAASTPTAASGNAARLEPGGAKAKIDGLIDDQVTGGTLTSDQADTLKSLFAEAGPKVDDRGGARGHRGGGDPAPDAMRVAADAPSSTTGTGTTPTTTGTGNETSDLLSEFLKQLQSTMTSGAGYSSSGTSSASYATSSLVVDFKA